ncbi:50S ribosomal protein L11 [Candidatus Amesbacteria bacterium RIFOXYB1_FULL_44_23]|uniref:Large ribosomal subunit protein uL11 n=1 Tax=Candidatus Amesbacteria bacterium RIFOXYB1_FULL_44_23 TaxID=1797263 RepID=A0A1F4ZU93_9BACT|nr:MAG: 50S ribosomal protein L11 [Candidatus Amesbacteria bacterium RIFOXYB1_FULL_44_23]
MAPKKVKVVLKLNLPAGSATPAPPVGPALGQHGIAIMDFVKQYNDKTKDQKGDIIPAVITVYEDRSFTFVTKLPPVSALIKKALGLELAAKKPGRETAGNITQEQIKEIAQKKLGDMNCDTLEAAIKSVSGTARSMGVKVI